MPKFIEHKGVAISNLLLDTENYRYKQGALPDQRGCIDKIVSDSKANILALAEDIAQNGLFPEPILAVKEGKQWKVLEGNRRVTALKLLNNPKLCPDDKKRQKLEAIKQQHSENIPKTISLYSCSDPQHIHEHIFRRHTGENKGIGLIGWGSNEVENYLVRNGRKSRYSLGRQVLDALDGKISVGDKFPITTLDRILKNKDARELLGLSVKNGELVGSELDEILATLKTIVEDLKAGKKTVTDLKKSEQIVDYVKSKGAKGKPTKDTAVQPIAKPSVKEFPAANGAAAEAVIVGGKAGKKSTPSHARTTIVPSETANFVPKKNAKAHDIFIELQLLNVDNLRIAGALLFRSFIELSIRHYVKEKKIPLGGKKIVKDEEKSYTKDLNQLIADTCARMQEDGLIDGSDKTRITSTAKKGISISDFNGYVHDEHALPVPDLLRATWVALEKMLRACWITEA